MLGKLKWDYVPLPPQPLRVRPTGDLQAAVATPSPARALQQQLELRTAALPLIEKWSARRRLAFIVASASTLWLAVLSAGAGVSHAIV